MCREQTIAALQREASVLQADNAAHVASKDTLFKHLQVCTKAVQQDTQPLAASQQLRSAAFAASA